MIYYVTPTYPRPEQVPELMRLAHTLMHVPRLHWIVADDQAVCSDRVLKILRYVFKVYELKFYISHSLSEGYSSFERAPKLNIGTQIMLMHGPRLH